MPPTYLRPNQMTVQDTLRVIQQTTRQMDNAHSSEEKAYFADAAQSLWQGIRYESDADNWKFRVQSQLDYLASVRGPSIGNPHGVTGPTSSPGASSKRASRSSRSKEVPPFIPDRSTKNNQSIQDICRREAEIFKEVDEGKEANNFEKVRSRLTEIVSLWENATKQFSGGIHYERCSKKLQDARHELEVLQRPQVEGDDGAQATSSTQSTTDRSSYASIEWDSVVGLADTKDMLYDQITLPLRMPEQFAGARMVRTFLLHGPPGTGKTALIEALVGRLQREASAGKTVGLRKITPDMINSKWQGEGEKNMRKEFDIAKREAPCIMFIDEIDVLTKSRADGKDSAGAGKVLTVILQQMDALRDSEVYVVGATNLLSHIDPAVSRRLQNKVEVPLPNSEAKAAILGSKLTMYHNLSAEQIKHLADSVVMQNYSGADIQTGVDLAHLSGPIVRIKNATHFVSRDGIYHCCSADAPGAVQMRFDQVPVGAKRGLEPLTYEDLHTAFSKQKPTTAVV